MVLPAVKTSPRVFFALVPLPFRGRLPLRVELPALRSRLTVHQRRYPGLVSTSPDVWWCWLPNLVCILALCGNLAATNKKPFCWLAEGPVCNVWRGLRGDFLNYFRSEECREMGERVA